MKIVHANTQTYGGAAIVAIRLHRALLEHGIHSSLVTRYGVNPSPLPSHEFFDNARLLYFLRKKANHGPLYSILKFIQGLRPHPNLANKPTGYEIFSPLHNYVIRNHQPFNDADIIHLHWINNFIDNRTFFERHKSKKFLWTLHDMNPITGGCHHSDGCLKFQSSCVKCPQLKGTINEDYSLEVLEAKEKGLSSLRDDQMVIVCPSTWLLNLSKSSRIAKRFRHVLIDNPSFESFPLSDDRAKLKSELNLPHDKKIVLFVCDNIRNPRKGIQILFDAAKGLRDLSKVHFVAIGNRAEAPDTLPITFAGSISNPQLLAKYYAAADIFVTTSLAENAPLVVIEALTCGTPVIGSNVGGIPDLIDKDSGMVFPVGNTKELTNALDQALFEREFNRQIIKKNARHRFDPHKVADRYLSVYKELVNP